VIWRGELWWADLGLPRGSRPALRRPVVIVSDDRYNRSALSTVTVVAATRTAALAAVPGNVLVPAGVGGLDHDSVVNVTQVATIDRRALEERIGALPDWLVGALDDGLGRALGLGRRG
jgi:mRNA interferase MazF